MKRKLWKFLITATSDLIIIQDLKTCHSERGFSWWWWLWWRWCWWWWWWCRWWCCPDTLVTVSKAFLLELFAEANSPPSQFDRQVTRWLYTMYIQSLYRCILYVYTLYTSVDGQAAICFSFSVSFQYSFVCCKNPSSLQKPPTKYSLVS